MQGSGLEVGDELYLTLAVSGSGRNSQRTQTFGSILKAQSSGEHAVTGAIEINTFGNKENIQMNLKDIRKAM